MTEPRAPFDLFERELGTSEPEEIVELVRSMELQLSDLYREKEYSSDGDTPSQYERVASELYAFYLDRDRLRERYGVDTSDDLMALIDSMEEQLTDLYTSEDGAEGGAPAAPLYRSLILTAAVTMAATIALSAMIYGVRPDGPLNGAFGLMIWLAMAIFGSVMALRARAPATAPRLMALAPVGGLVTLLVVLAALSHTAGKPILRIDYVLHCLQTVGLLACLPFVCVSLVLHSGDPASPVLAGAAAGFSAGAIAALAYSISCPISDPLASLSAHAMTVLILTSIGALIGWRLYAW